MHASTIEADGFAVLPGPLGPDLASALRAARVAIAAASQSDVREGSTTWRVNGMLERAPALAALRGYPPLLEIARTLCGGPFRPSSFHARGLRPGAAAQKLHRDVQTGADGWPLTGLIWMVDCFTAANGATRFLPGSSLIKDLPDAQLTLHPDEVRACGPAGSLIVYDGSLWHGHGRNETLDWRWSIQGAFVPGE